MSNLNIRPVRFADHDQWRPLWDGYNAFYGRAGETALPAEITATTWGRFFAEDEPMWCLVAERDGALVGLVHYLFHRSTTKIEPTCYLQDLFTDATTRGQGVGRALIEGVYAQAAAAGLHTVYWHTHETNETAMRLYDQVAVNGRFWLYRQAV